MVYNTNELKAVAAADVVLDLADPKWKGKLALAPTETDFQPIVTAVAARYGNAAADQVAEGDPRNASDHIYPDNETLVAEVNAGQAQLGVINHYYWYRLRDELGASKIHSAEHFFAPGDPGYVIDVVGRRHPRVEHAPGRGSEVPRVPRQQAGPGDHRPRRELRVPARLGRRHRQAARAVRDAAARPDHGDAARERRRAIALLRQASLL